MTHLPTSLLCDDAMNQADLVLDGYTVSVRGRCMARIGATFVMREGLDRCVRIPATNTDALLLGTMWADFCRPVSGVQEPPVASDAPLRGTVPPKDVSLVLQGYTTNTHGVCLARVIGHYVARDGARRCIRFLVDTVDPVKLGAAWAAFSDAAGWVRAVSAAHLETLNQPAAHWSDAGEERSAAG
jgi:hypothetical protein